MQVLFYEYIHLSIYILLLTKKDYIVTIAGSLVFAGLLTQGVYSKHLNFIDKWRKDT